MNKFARMAPEQLKKYGNWLLDSMAELMAIPVLHKLARSEKELEELVAKREHLILEWSLLQTVWSHQYDFDKPITPYREKVLENVYDQFNDAQKRYTELVNFFNDFIKEREKDINEDGSIKKEPRTREEILESLSEEDQKVFNTLGSMCDTVIWVDDEFKEGDKMKAEHIRILYNRNGPVSD